MQMFTKCGCKNQTWIMKKMDQKETKTAKSYKTTTLDLITNQALHFQSQHYLLRLPRCLKF